MSYRAFKHLLGETSLERKCRFLFGAGILLLITGSFWLYAYLTESLAYKETARNCRLLVEHIRIERHLEWEAKKAAKDPKAPLLDIGVQEHYQYHWLRDNQPNLEPYDREVLKKFASAEEPEDKAIDTNAPEEVLGSQEHDPRQAERRPVILDLA